MLGVRSGDKLLFESDGKGVRIRPIKNRSAFSKYRGIGGTLVAAAPVLAELSAAPGRSEKFVGSFFEETGIGVDWELSVQIWRLAGRAFQAYADRGRKQRDKGARRILADFVIGAHAFANGFRLLTLDEGLYRPAFPSLAIETF